MAPMLRVRLLFLRGILHALTLMTTAIGLASATTQALSVNCTDIHPNAFGNQALKPGTCYLTRGESGFFVDARTYCQGLSDEPGWDVADIEDAVEQQIIHDGIGSLIATRRLPSTIAFRMGQNEMKTEGMWRYLSGDAEKCARDAYLDWHRNADTTERRRRYNCVNYLHRYGGMLNGVCDGDANLLCELSPFPESVSACSDYDNTTEVPDECEDILPGAFGNPFKPGVCYTSESSQLRTFEEAQSFCHSLPGGNWSLVDIEDEEESFHLELWNRQKSPTLTGYWIGQNAREEKGHYQYTSGGKCPVYLQWYHNHLGSRDDKSRDCIFMHTKYIGCFGDAICDGTESHYTLCKFRGDLNQTVSPSDRCSYNMKSNDTAECTSLRADAFGMVGRPGICYFVIRYKKNWQAAVDLCKTAGWSLVDVEDAEENEMLVQRFKYFVHVNATVWVGQNNKKMQGAWKYLSYYTPHTRGVFLNGLSSSTDHQRCIGISVGGKWNLHHCESVGLVTCKKRNSRSIIRSRELVLLSSDATCDPQDTLTPSYSVKTRIQCASKCLSRHDCHGFGFVAAGNEDNCKLCGRVHSILDLKFKAGSQFYHAEL